jgi:hypothetical protein
VDCKTQNITFSGSSKTLSLTSGFAAQIISFKDLFASSHEIFCPITSYQVKETDSYGTTLSTLSSSISQTDLVLVDNGLNFNNHLIYVVASTGNVTLDGLLAKLTVSP